MNLVARIQVQTIVQEPKLRFVITGESVLRSSIPIPPANFRLREDHLSGGTMLKGNRRKDIRYTMVSINIRLYF